jgi:hypothetical protein
LRGTSVCGVPFVFVTGHNVAELLDLELRQSPRVPKPIVAS